MDAFAQQAVAVLLVSLRLSPTLAFAQPFTLVRIPAAARMFLGVGISAWLVHANPAATWQQPFWDKGLPMVAAGELFLGITLALTLQLAFAALLTAGRTIDIQAGFGMAALVDPATRGQLPLVGTLFAYAAAAIFFTIGGPADVLAVVAASLERVPLGVAALGHAPQLMIAYCSAVFLSAIGLAGLTLLVLFLLDLTVAFLSRTLPQMNVLLFGFQVKAIAVLAMLPITFALSAALFARLLRQALQTMPQLI